MVPKDVVCVTVKELWVKEEWLIEVYKKIQERRAYRDGIKRKEDKIGMVSVVSSKMRMVSEEL